MKIWIGLEYKRILMKIAKFLRTELNKFDKI